MKIGFIFDLAKRREGVLIADGEMIQTMRAQGLIETISFGSGYVIARELRKSASRRFCRAMGGWYWKETA